MRYEAIIFDLFGTLVDNVNAGYCALLARHGVLGRLAPGREADFSRVWASRDVQRMRTLGIFDSTASALRHICSELEIPWDYSIVERAVELRLQRYRAALAARPGTIDTLIKLKRSGRKLALMSDCSCEAPLLWSQTLLSPLFDEALFSCQIGLAKPHPQFYALACKRLGLRPDQCLYVGDGDGRELTGATAAGMDAVLISAPHEENIVMRRAEVRNWTGPRISAIGEVLELLAEREAAEAPAPHDAYSDCTAFRL